MPRSAIPGRIFSSALRACFEIEGDDIDSDRISFRRVELERTDCDWSKSDPSKVVNLAFQIQNRGIVCCDETISDGVYRYEAEVYDKAGNEAIFRGALFSDGSSGICVVDTEPGGAFVSIFCEGELAARYRANGSPELYGDAFGSDGAVIEFRADTMSEHLPVLIRGTVTLADGSTETAVLDEWTYGGAAELEIRGQGEFYISGIYVEDLAGNHFESSMEQPMILDSKAPEITDFSIENAPAAASLYNEDVLIRLKAGEGKKGEASGIEDVIFRLFDGEELVRETVMQKENEDPSAGRRSDAAASNADELIMNYERTIVCEAGFDSDELTAEIEISDRAGNRSKKRITFGIDAVPPQIEAEVEKGKKGANGTSSYKEAVCVNVRIRERHFREDETHILINGENSHEPVEWQRSEDGSYGTVLLFEEDGEYELMIRSVDGLGNRSEVRSNQSGEELKFTVDRTIPETTVRIDGTIPETEEMLYRNGDTEVLVSVKDEHFEGNHALMLVRNDGTECDFEVNPSGLTAKLTSEGEYVLSGCVMDAAGNASKEIGPHQIMIDRTAPEVEISGVKNGESLKEVPELTFWIREDRPDFTKTVLTRIKQGGAEEEMQMEFQETESGLMVRPIGIEPDDYYRLRLTAYDLAGNDTERTVSFSVNTSGPVFENLNPEEAGLIRRDPVSPEFRITDPDPFSVISVQVNGSDVPYEFENGILRLSEELQNDGKYLVTIRARDTAGYDRTMEAAEYVIDRTPPVLYAQVEGGMKHFYKGDVCVVLKTDDPSADFCELETDGEVRRENHRTIVTVSGDQYGKHLIRARLRDEAGNESDEWSFSFTVLSDLSLIVPAVILGTAAAGLLVIICLRNRKKE